MLYAGFRPAGSSKTKEALLGACSLLLGAGLLGLGITESATKVAQTPQPPAIHAAIASAVEAHTLESEPSTTATSETPVSAVVNASPAPPNVRGPVPTGKGMWMWQPARTEGGNVKAIIAKAQAVGLTHIYVRMGSSKAGFHAGPFLDQILPAAHAAGIRIYGWDFPYLNDVSGDVVRALQAIKYGTPDGHRIDGFAADIEFRSMGVDITPFTAAAYGASLRHEVGNDYPLIAVVPKPNQHTRNYPYDAIVKDFDAIAPMIYWMQTDPAHAVNQAFDRLAQFGKPIIPIGQAYDGFAEGGPAGIPAPPLLHRFMDYAAARGAAGVSFWSWQAADAPTFQAIAQNDNFRLPASIPQALRVDQIRAFQVLLTTLGFPVAPDGVWGAQSDAALRAFQKRANLDVNGLIDNATRAMLLQPVNPPLKP